MDVDLRGVFLGMKYGIRRMRDAGGGAIVNWSSVGGLTRRPAGRRCTTRRRRAWCRSRSRRRRSTGAKACASTACAPASSRPRSWARPAARVPRDRQEGVARPRRTTRGGRRGRGVPVLRPRVVRVRRDHPRRRRLVRTTSLNEAPVTTTDFSETDLFRDKELPQDPYPFYDWVREQGPIWYYPLWDVWLVTGYEEAISVYHDQATFSNCNTVSGPFVKFSGAARGRRHQRHHRGAPRRAAVQRPAALVRPAEAHRAPRAADAADHAEAAQGERGVHVAARRPPDRRVHRPRRVRVHRTTTRTRSRCS